MEFQGRRAKVGVATRKECEMTIWSWETWRNEQKRIYDWADWQEFTHEETWRAATMAERERCAEIASGLAHNHDFYDGGYEVGNKIADAIKQPEWSA